MTLAHEWLSGRFPLGTLNISACPTSVLISTGKALKPRPGIGKETVTEDGIKRALGRSNT